MNKNEKIKKLSISGIAYSILLFALAILTVPALAQVDQQNELSLKLSRDFGYGLAGQMQGTFSYIVSGPESLSRVEFILDDQVIGEDSTSPFRFQFNTGDFANGSHRLKAIGYTTDDQMLESATITRQFVPGNAVKWIVIVIVALAVVGRLVATLLTRSSRGAKPGTKGYGYLGGAVCPSCGHPFAIHWWSLRLGFGRFDRCSNCGKWHLVQRASAERLVEADEFVMGLEAEPGVEDSLETQKDGAYRRLLDESRFDES